MIAIPIDTEQIDAKSSKLFGNVNMFAMYEPKEKSFHFIKNTGSGNGIETAKFLKEAGATSTVYSYMGDGPFKQLINDDIEVYYIGKKPMDLSNILSGFLKQEFIKVDATNASTYLDPGTATQNCECGCS